MLERVPRPLSALLPLVVGLGLVTTPRSADAQTAPPPVPGRPSAEAPSTTEAEWNHAFQDARAALLAGRFTEAGPALLALADRAPSEVERRLALELAALCTAWNAAGRVLVAPNAAPPPPSPTPTRAVTIEPDLRTTDELAVLYTNAVLYGLGSGIVLAVHTEPDSAAAGILPALALGGGGAALVYALDRGDGLRYGVPASIVSGLYIGLEEGLAWTLWRQASARYEDEWSGKAVATLTWATGTAFALAGGVLGHVYGTTPGRASLTGSTALWSGLGAGLLVGALAPDDAGQADDAALLAAAIALNVGAVGGVFLGARVEPSIARVRFLDLGALAGGITATGLYVALAGEDDSDGRATLAVAALGIAVGAGTAWTLTADMTPDPRRRGRSVMEAMRPTLLPIASRDGGSPTLGFGVAGAL